MQRPKFKFKPQDTWIGVYWKAKIIKPEVFPAQLSDFSYKWDLYICIIPCLPIHFSWVKPYTKYIGRRKYLRKLLEWTATH